jgi:hypothetical protein
MVATAETVPTVPQALSVVAEAAEVEVEDGFS